MGFRAPPHPISQLSPHGRCARREMRSVLEIGELYQLDIGPGCTFFGLNQHIVCLDI